MSFGLTLFGPSFKLPGWALGISPTTTSHTSRPEHWDWRGLLWISLFTLAFLVIGFAGFRRQDVP